MRYAILAGVTVAAAAVTARPAAAQVPGTVTFTARVVDNGTPVTGAHGFTFRLFDAATGGAQRWSEGHSAVPVTDGLVSVALGSMTPLTVAIIDGDPLWVEIAMDGDTMSPRLPLRSVPYSVRSGDAASVGGFSASAFATAGHNHDAAPDLYLASKLALRGSDSWLRLNQDNAFTSGVHTPYNLNAAGLTVGALYYHPGAGNLEATGTGYFQAGGRFNGIAVGSAPFGAVSYPYETIQLDPGFNLRFNFGTNERMLLANDGRLWMSTNAGDCPGGWFCNGMFWDISVASMLYSGLAQRSDERLKKEIRAIETGLPAVMALRPVTFEWRDPTMTGRRHGFIAQQVRTVIPDLVTETDDGTLTLDAQGILPSVVKAVQELKTENDQLRAEVAALRAGGQTSAAPAERRSWISTASVGLGLLIAFAMWLGISLGRRRRPT